MRVGRSRTARRTAGDEGFTLIELLVVVVILGVLATMAIPRVLGAIDRARESKGTADLRVIVSALERFYFDRGRYPYNLGELTAGKYLKSDFDFRNSYGDRYLYAVLYHVAGGVSQPDHLKEFVLGNPSNPPAEFAGDAALWWWDGSGGNPGLPRGIDPSFDAATGLAVPGYWWGVATPAAGGWNNDHGLQPDNAIRIQKPGEANAKLHKPTRPDLQYD